MLHLHGMDHKNHLSSDLVWNILRAAALLFAVVSIGIFINSRTDTKEVATTQETQASQAFVHSVQPDAATYIAFDVPEATLTTPADITLLPESVDQQFVDIVQSLLDDNNVDELGCVNAYSLLRYSNVNAQLIREAVDAETLDFGGDCGGGVVVTYSNIDDQWQETPFVGQSQIACADTIRFGLFNEFSGPCIDGEETKSNPNGSILDW